MQKSVTYWLQLLLAMFLLLLSGLFSTYYYFVFFNQFGPYLPGMFYTSCTLVVFYILQIQYPIKKLLIYYLLMNLVYIVMFFLTLLSSWFSFLGGIVTAGMGAVFTFLLVDRYIINFNFNKTKLFIWGGLTFLLIDIWYLSFEQTPLERYFNIQREIETVYCEIFIVWHLVIGTKLFIILKKSVSNK